MAPSSALPAEAWGHRPEPTSMIYLSLGSSPNISVTTCPLVNTAGCECARQKQARSPAQCCISERSEEPPHLVLVDTTCATLRILRHRWKLPLVYWSSVTERRRRGKKWRLRLERFANQCRG